MTNNDILRRLRFALKLKDSFAASLFSKDPNNAIKIDAAGFKARIAKPDEAHFTATNDRELGAFLDGLIAERRGLRTDVEAVPPAERLSKNEILKKLRIAFALREESLLKVLHRGGSKLTRSELGALFRKPGHKHYRECGDQVLRAFLTGLIDRPTDVAESSEADADTPNSIKPWATKTTTSHVKKNAKPTPKSKTSAKPAGKRR